MDQPLHNSGGHMVPPARNYARLEVAGRRKVNLIAPIDVIFCSLAPKLTPSRSLIQIQPPQNFN